MAKSGGMHEKSLAGLKKWAEGIGTVEIAEHLEGHGIDDPKALAVWLRKQAIGEEKFKLHQKLAREGKPIPGD
jgi:hypothetical protein